MQDSVADEVRENFAAIKKNVAEACARAGRSPADVQILAATKAQPVEKIRAAIDAGISACGENYLQEAERKINEIGRAVEWHFIGHLQGNKAKKAVQLFDCIQSLDSIKLAGKIDAAALSPLPVFVEVNIAKEESKFGVSPAGLPEFLASLEEFRNLQVRGLFCMAPFLPSGQTRPCFRKMRQLAARFSLGELSMGMSNDYAVAVQEGSTMVRIGTALFGERK
jgi:pyridoxal phosphate enzyme (YggS family)